MNQKNKNTEEFDFPSFSFKGIQKLIKGMKEGYKEEGYIVDEEIIKRHIDYEIFCFVYRNKRTAFITEDKVVFEYYPTTRKNWKINSNITTHSVKDVNGNPVPYNTTYYHLKENGFMSIAQGYSEGKSSRLYRIKHRVFHIKDHRPNKTLVRLLDNAKRKKGYEGVKDIFNNYLETYKVTRVDVPEELYKKQDRGTQKVIDKINKGDIKVNDLKFSSGRIYHPVQQLPENIRAYIRFEGEETTETDINTFHLQLLVNRIVKQYPSYKTIPKDLKFLYWLKNNGNLYEGIAELLESSRDEAKTIVNIVIHDKFKEFNGVPGLSKLFEYKRKLFQNNFPTLMIYLETLKEKDYKEAYRTLFWDEFQIKQDLINRFTHILDVHDSFIVSSKYVGDVDRILEEDHNINMSKTYLKESVLRANIERYKLIEYSDEARKKECNFKMNNLVNKNVKRDTRTEKVF